VGLALGRMVGTAGAAQAWYLLVPSDAQMMADGSIAKGVTIAQYPQAAAFDTAAACEGGRDTLGNLRLRAAQRADGQRKAADKAYDEAPVGTYDTKTGTFKGGSPKRDELRDARQKAQVAYFEAVIRLDEMRIAVCISSDDPRLQGPGR